MHNFGTLLILALFSLFSAAKEPVISVEKQTGFPAISKDGKSAAFIFTDRADYSGELPKIFQVRNIDTGKVQTQFSITNGAESIANKKTIAKLLIAENFQPIPVLKGEYKDRVYVMKSGDLIFKAMEEQIVVERNSHQIMSRKIPKGTLTGICCGDFENQKRKCSVFPSYYESWFLPGKSIFVINYDYSAARDGCEGKDNFEIVVVKD